ncbi:pyridoxamine 5'-phosphate oxidase-domain-containing protein [Syncephalis fuscata]|nr:pyridoxamine 5'-phosphate oxidase-domain-containing protein [Syncephalis fuscata]
MCTLPPWKIPLLKSLSRSLQTHGPSSGFMQLATTNVASGLPNCRTIAFRGFLLDASDTDYAKSTAEQSKALNNPTSIIKFTSDIRAIKIQSLLAQPVGEICWYHAGTREQYRLSVCLYPVFAPGHPQQPALNQLAPLLPNSMDNSSYETMLARLHKEREEMWLAANDDIKISMAWPSPGKPLNADIIRPSSLSSDTLAKAYENFVLVLAVPWQVDQVELDATPFRRTLWHINPSDGQHPEHDIHKAGQTEAWKTTPLNP